MISFEENNNKFNFRVAGIFLDKDKKKFLTNTRANIDFCVLPGGRVEIGEDSATSLKREILEELGVEIDIVGIKCITENFFEFDNKNYHELQYVYVAELRDKEILNKVGKFMGVENKDIYEWKNISNLDKINYKPAYLKEIIKEVDAGDFQIRHITHKGNG